MDYKMDITDRHYRCTSHVDIKLMHITDEHYKLTFHMDITDVHYRWPLQ